MNRYAKLMHSYWVYILQCSDGSYYTGVTNDHVARIAQHHGGKHRHCYTFKRRPVELVYLAGFHEILDAISWEKQIKGWGRKKKEALIKEHFEELPKLAARHTPFTKKQCHPEEERMK